MPFADFAMMAALAMSVSSAGALPPAQLLDVHGSVMVSHAGVYRPVQAAQALAAGDRVVTLKGGAARIAFTSGCSIALRSAEMVTVQAKQPCAGVKVVGVATQAAGAGGAILGVSTPVAVGLGVAAAVAIGVGVGVSQGGSHSP